MVLRLVSGLFALHTVASIQSFQRSLVAATDSQFVRITRTNDSGAPAVGQVQVLRSGLVVYEANVTASPGESLLLDTTHLPPHQPLTYMVRTSNDRSSPLPWSDWSPPVSLIIGPGARIQDWAGADWVCTSASSTDGRSSMLRKEFVIPSLSSLSSATLFIVGLGTFRAWLNGHEVSQGEVNTPGWTNWRNRTLYSTYPIDITWLEQTNALAVLLGNGMYNVPTPISSRYTKFTGSFGPRMLLGQLHVTYSNGTSSLVLSTTADGTWGSTDGGPVLFTHQYAGEDYNASLALPGWDQPGFSPQSDPAVQWTPAVNCTAQYPGGLLLPSDFEPIGVMETLPIVNITATEPPGTLLVDFGRNHAGYVSLSLSGVPAGSVVRVQPSETAINGQINQASGGTPMYWQYYTAPPATGVGNATVDIVLEPVFSTYGYRWVAVSLVSPTTGRLQADNGTVVVINATYGLNCNAALGGDVTQSVSSVCNGKVSCPYQVCVCGDNSCSPDEPPCIPDPATNCAKDFRAAYSCTKDPPGTVRSVYLPAEADNYVALLTCGPTPVPVVPNITAGHSNFFRASVDTVGTWTSSSTWVNAIHEITLEAVKANLQSVLTDCPHRERLGWLEVSHLMFPSIAYNFKIQRLWGKIALDTVDSQLASGMVPDIAPEYTVFSGGFRDSPEWGSAALMNPAWLYSWYGDAAILNTTYSTATAYVEYLLTQVDRSTGLLTYGLGDWIPVLPSPPGVTATGVLVQDLQALASIAHVLGKDGDAQKYSALAEQFADLYHSSFWSSSNSSYPTQCAAGFALSLNITPPADQPLAYAYLLQDVLSRGNVTTAGEIGNRYALLALANEPSGAGIDAVWSSLLRSTAPGYGWMLSMGETALAESWFDAAEDSHIHAMYGHIDEFLYTHIAGIQQDGIAPQCRGGGRAGGREQGTGQALPHFAAAGWKCVRIAPRIPRGLEWVNATFDSPRGMIRSSWAVTALSDASPGCAAAGVAAGAPSVVEVRVQSPRDTHLRVRLPLSGKELQAEAGEMVVLRDALC